MNHRYLWIVLGWGLAWTSVGSDRLTAQSLTAASPAEPTTRPPQTSTARGVLTSTARAATAPGPQDEKVDEEKPLEMADLICVVGGEHILAGDMMIYVDPVIEEHRKNMTAAQEAMARQQLMRRVLVQYVEVKALYQEFFREAVGKTAPAEAKEAQQKIRSKASKVFFEKQVPNLLKAHSVTDVKALEEKLRSKSMSISQLQQRFVEQVLATEAERRHVPEDVEISRDELLQYYQDNASEWQEAGRARWRQLTARFDRFANDKAAAKAAIEAMGNEIFLGGKPFEAVAKSSSQGFTADEGGVFDWTTQGALKSKALDEAIFNTKLPVGYLSQVIEDEVGYHIIEVLEREDARTISFDEAHDEMHTALSERKKNELREAFHKKVMERTTIWTRWPEDIPGSRSLSEVLAE